MARGKPKKHKPLAGDSAQGQFVSAIKAGDADQVKALLEGGEVDIEFVDKSGTQSFNAESPLLAAVTSDQLEVVRLLLKHSADPNAIPKHLGRGISPLCAALRLPTFEVADLLIDHGANVNFYDYRCQDDSPLLNAIRNDNEAAVKYLLSKGADASRGLDYCISHHTSDTMRRLFPGDDSDWPKLLRMALGEGEVEDVERLYAAHKFPLNDECPGLHGNVLNVACLAKDPLPVVRKLIEWGARPDHIFGRDSPLITAADRGHTEVVRLFLEHGAAKIIDYIRLIRDDKATALYKGYHYPEVVELLIDAGADPFILCRDFIFKKEWTVVDLLKKTAKYEANYEVKFGHLSGHVPSESPAQKSLDIIIARYPEAGAPKKRANSKKAAAAAEPKGKAAAKPTKASSKAGAAKKPSAAAARTSKKAAAAAKTAPARGRKRKAAEAEGEAEENEEEAVEGESEGDAAPAPPPAKRARKTALDDQAQARAEDAEAKRWAVAGNNWRDKRAAERAARNA